MTKIIDLFFVAVFAVLAVLSLSMCVYHQSCVFMFYTIACALVAYVMVREFRKIEKA